VCAAAQLPHTPHLTIFEMTSSYPESLFHLSQEDCVQISPLLCEDIPSAAGLFSGNFRALRQALPDLPNTLESPSETTSRLQPLQAAGRLLAARQNGIVVGYLGWYIVPNFRNSGRTVAYCPEWAHAAGQNDLAEVYAALYRHAAGLWAAADCQAHALTLLANDPLLKKFWFWNGFGLLVVDAVRSMQPPHAPLSPDFQVRRASPADARALSELDIEHRRHYSASPVFMASMQPTDAAAFEAFLFQPGNSVWMALEGWHPVGFMRFEPGGHGSDVLVTADTIGISGAYIRPPYRGKRLAVAILEAALAAYAELGFTRCAVDFESFNPEATAFWLKHFTPVCYSIMRVPESLGTWD